MHQLIDSPGQRIVIVRRVLFQDIGHQGDQVYGAVRMFDDADRVHVIIDITHILCTGIALLRFALI